MLLRNPLVKPLMVLVFLAGVAFGPAGRAPRPAISSRGLTTPWPSWPSTILAAIRAHSPR